MLSETDRTCPSTLTVVDTTTWRGAGGWDRMKARQREWDIDGRDKKVRRLKMRYTGENEGRGEREKEEEKKKCKNEGLQSWGSIDHCKEELKP